MMCDEDCVRNNGAQLSGQGPAVRGARFGRVAGQVAEWIDDDEEIIGKLFNFGKMGQGGGLAPWFCDVFQRQWMNVEKLSKHALFFGIGRRFEVNPPDFGRLRRLSAKVRKLFRRKPLAVPVSRRPTVNGQHKNGPVTGFTRVPRVQS